MLSCGNQIVPAGWSATVMNAELWVLQFQYSQACIIFHIKNWLMHTFIINTALITLCHFRYVLALKGPSSVSTTHISTARSAKWVTRCKIQLSEQCVICSLSWLNCTREKYNVSYVSHTWRIIGAKLSF